MAQTVRQNFLLPKTTKQLLDEMIPKGRQSSFVAESIEVSLRAKKSWRPLHANPILGVKNPLSHSKKIRKEWDKE